MQREKSAARVTTRQTRTLLANSALQEVSNLDRENKVKVKPLQSVKHSDRVLYKLVDLTEISNPGKNYAPKISLVFS